MSVCVSDIHHVHARQIRCRRTENVVVQAKSLFASISITLSVFGVGLPALDVRQGGQATSGSPPMLVRSTLWSIIEVTTGHISQLFPHLTHCHNYFRFGRSTSCLKPDNREQILFSSSLQRLVIVSFLCHSWPFSCVVQNGGKNYFCRQL